MQGGKQSEDQNMQYHKKWFEAMGRVFGLTIKTLILVLLKTVPCLFYIASLHMTLSLLTIYITILKSIV